MNLLVVGSVALDSVETPFGRTENALGGSAVFFGVAGSLLHPVQVVGVVGRDYPMAELQRLAARGLDLRGVTVADGESFRWAGKYGFDLQTRDTLETRLGVFANFKPVIPEPFRDAGYVFLGNIDPELQLEVLEQVRRPKLVACDTMNYWIQGKRTALVKLLERVDVLLLNDSEVRELSGDWHIHRAARWVLERGPKYVVVKKGEHGAVLVAKDRIFYVPAYPARRRVRSDGRRRFVRRRVHGAPGADRRHLRGQPAPGDGLRLGDGVVRGGAVLGGPVRGDHAGRRDGAGAGVQGPRPLRPGARDGTWALSATAARAWTSRRRRRPRRASRSWCGARARPRRSARWARSAAWCGFRPTSPTRCSSRPPTAWARRCWSRSAPAGTAPSARTSSTTA